MTTVTRTYTRLHNAIVSGAKRAGLRFHDARVLVAVADRGGEATSREVFEDITTPGGRERGRPDRDGARVRKSIGVLRDTGFVTAEPPDPAGFRGKGTGRGWRAGMVLRVALTQAGRALADEILQAAKGRAK
jgi:hypothetical protein